MKYSPVIYRREFTTRAEAEAALEIMADMLVFMSRYQDVFLRQPPNLYSEDKFEEERTVWYAHMRFAVKPAEGAEGRIIKADRSTCDDGPLPLFGFPKN